MFGTTADFEPVVEKMIAAGLKPPYDWDEYASYFFIQAHRLVVRAASSHEKEKASELFLCVHFFPFLSQCFWALVLYRHCGSRKPDVLTKKLLFVASRRASALYRIARFPAPRSEQQRIAWERGKEAALEGLKLQKYPMVEVEIPHTHAANGDGKVLPAYYHLPLHAFLDHRVPLVIIFTGLDGYRTDLAVWKDGWARLGVALLIVEIPGTGDNPGAASDPESPDRVWTSMFDWIGKQECIDQSRVVNWGFSTGGYYSIRLAHTHGDRLKGVVALGGGCHHMFDAEWLDAANSLEYPFEYVLPLYYHPPINA